MQSKKDVWSSNWQRFQKNPELIHEHTRIRPGFAQECYQIIAKHLSPDTKTILELGCGTGRFTLQLAQDYPNSTFEGSDISEEAVKLAQAGALLRNINNAVFHRDDITSLQPLQQEYDLVFNEGTVDIFPGDKDYEVLKGLYHFVKPGGLLLIGVPNKRCYVHTINKYLQGRFYKYGFERSYSREQLKEYFSRLGLTDIQVQGVSFCHGCKRYGYPAKILAHIYQWLSKRDTKIIEKWDDLYGFYLFVSGRKFL